MKAFPLRLKLHEDLKESLKNFVIQEDIKAGFILSAIVSLEKAKIRFANQAIIGLTQKPSENLISLCPTLREAALRLRFFMILRKSCISTVLTEKFEIIALNGTIATTGVHLHIVISDREGKTIGGHLDYGCIIYTTAEIVIGASEEFTLNRTFDEQTGCQELEIIRDRS